MSNLFDASLLVIAFFSNAHNPNLFEIIYSYSTVPLEPSTNPSTLRQPSQRLAIDPQPHPRILPHRAQTRIKLQTRLIPFQTTPLQPLPSNVQHLLRQRLDQRLAIPPLPVLRLDEQVLEIYTRHACPCAVVVEV